MNRTKTVNPVRSSSRLSLHRNLIAGAAACVLLIGGLGGWASTTPLEGAVVVHGQLVVEGNVKQVQHRDGGIVSEIKVRDGDRVRAGDVMLRLDETVPRANLAIIEKQMVDLTAKRLRLEAEQTGAAALAAPESDPTLPEGKEEDLAQSLRAETALFEARRRMADGQKSSLAEEANQIRAGIKGLEAKLAATREQLGYIDEELTSVSSLISKNLVTMAKVSELRRTKSGLNGSIGQLENDIAQANVAIAQSEVKILQVDRDRQAEVETDMREVSANLAELAERRAAARDQLDRVVIRAPQDGIVDQLAVHTVGGVIAPGEKIALIVPDEDQLVVETRVRPADIDHVRVGQSARVRIDAFDHRESPELFGQVVTVSADVATDQMTRETYYVARVFIPEEERTRLGRPLVPGMPSEVFLNTGSRTALQYLLKPLTDQLSHAMRES